MFPLNWFQHQSVAWTLTFSPMRMPMKIKHLRNKCLERFSGKDTKHLQTHFKATSASIAVRNPPAHISAFLSRYVSLHTSDGIILFRLRHHKASLATVEASKLRKENTFQPLLRVWSVEFIDGDETRLSPIASLPLTLRFELSPSSDDDFYSQYYWWWNINLKMSLGAAMARPLLIEAFEVHFFALLKYELPAAFQISDDWLNAKTSKSSGRGTNSFLLCVALHHFV